MGVVTGRSSTPENSGVTADRSPWIMPGWVKRLGSWTPKKVPANGRLRVGHLPPWGGNKGSTPLWAQESICEWLDVKFRLQGKSESLRGTRGPRPFRKVRGFLREAPSSLRPLRGAFFVLRGPLPNRCHWVYSPSYYVENETQKRSRHRGFHYLRACSYVSSDET